MAPLPSHPRHPERICWGCDRYCAVDDLGCANGTIRTPHPIELFGEDWMEWFEQKDELESGRPAGAAAVSAPRAPR